MQINLNLEQTGFLYQAMVNTYLAYGTVKFPVDAILAMKELRPKSYLDELPNRFRDEDKIRVYRASSTPPNQIEKVNEEFSWTLHCKDAILYAHNSDERYFYCGEINKDDIIAYTVPSHQIVQYKSIENLEHISRPMFEKYVQIYKSHETRDLLEDYATKRLEHWTNGYPFFVFDEGIPSYVSRAVPRVGKAPVKSERGKCSAWAYKSRRKEPTGLREQTSC